MPWYTLIPPYKGNAANGHAWVPMDDYNCMAWTMTFHPVRDLTDEEVKLMRKGAGVHAELIPGTFRPVANRSNGYLMDRDAQETGKYSAACRARDPGRLDPGKHGPRRGPRGKTWSPPTMPSSWHGGAARGAARGRQGRAGPGFDPGRRTCVLLVRAAG